MPKYIDGTVSSLNKMDILDRAISSGYSVDIKQFIQTIDLLLDPANQKKF